jgi:hypothetical protein
VSADGREAQAVTQRVLQRGPSHQAAKAAPVPADERGINRGGGPYIAWFKDPAGNILSVLQER